MTLTTCYHKCHISDTSIMMSSRWHNEDVTKVAPLCHVITDNMRKCPRDALSLMTFRKCHRYDTTDDINNNVDGEHNCCGFFVLDNVAEMVTCIYTRYIRRLH